MRTTLTLDDDVARELERYQRVQDKTLKAAINDALRAGLLALQRRAKPARTYQPIVRDLGSPRLAHLDNIGEVLAQIEGDDHR